MKLYVALGYQSSKLKVEWQFQNPKENFMVAEPPTQEISPIIRQLAFWKNSQFKAITIIKKLSNPYALKNRISTSHHIIYQKICNQFTQKYYGLC